MYIDDGHDFHIESLEEMCACEVQNYKTTP